MSISSVSSNGVSPYSTASAASDSSKQIAQLEKQKSTLESELTKVKQGSGSTSGKSEQEQQVKQIQQQIQQVERQIAQLNSRKSDTSSPAEAPAPANEAAQKTQRNSEGKTTLQNEASDSAGEVGSLLDIRV